ncbi:hypothetical protein [Frigidibacter oleivorans]|uniref:hypothetical protein n=1 Tax=Frigidibacter oleivorans TaxID=2487129 RepID=UPI000F8D23E2|nr:hypothetical protein [Frigidibacter oleivorans]
MTGPESKDTGIAGRRRFLALAAAAAGAALSPGPGEARQAARQAAGAAVEVEGFAPLPGAGAQAGAMRLALADALLAAALAGGAEVRGRTVMAGTRVTSDIVMVRPMGQVLAYEVLARSCDAAGCRVRLRAHVAPAATGACPARRHLLLAVPPPDIRVSTAAPAWAAALADDLALRLVALAEAAPEVAGLTRLPRDPARPEPRGSALYRAATGTAAVGGPGDHLLMLALRLEIVSRDLRLEVQAELRGPGGERMATRFAAAIPAPRPSILGDAAAVIAPDRAQMAQRLTRGAGPALSDLFARAGCRPALAVLRWTGGRLVAAAGARHGIGPASLAVTDGGAGFPGILEVTRLGPDSCELRPLDPAARAADHAGRLVRFVGVAEPLR